MSFNYSSINHLLCAKYYNMSDESDLISVMKNCKHASQKVEYYKNCFNI